MMSSTELNKYLKYGTTKTQNSQSSLQKMNKARGITFSDFRLQNRVIVNKNSMIHKNTHVGQWNKNREPRNKLTHLWLINL